MNAFWINAFWMNACWINAFWLKWYTRGCDWNSRKVAKIHAAWDSADCDLRVPVEPFVLSPLVRVMRLPYRTIQLIEKEQICCDYAKARLLPTEALLR